MALQSEVSPPIGGEPNKVTQIEGDTKSEGEEDSSSSTDDDEIDLEEGEILDSGAEEEEKKDFTNSSLKDALDQSCLQSIEKLLNSSKATSAAVEEPIPTNISSPHKKSHRSSNYRDYDHATDDEDDGWRPSSPKHRRKFNDKPIDYRMELAAYRGTPPSSPERTKRDDKSRKKKSSKKSKRKTINRKDIKGKRVNYIIESKRRTLCRFFKEGKCVKGSECEYSHEKPVHYKKKELCKFYLNGHCNKGRDCNFMHGEFPCKFYHTGSECYAKDDCRFSHTPLTDEMKRILADYLQMTHGDREEEYQRMKRRRSPEPPPPPRPPQPPPRAASPPRRTCLLGSPPRHIREAEETRRWQEEMKALQHPSFQIQINPDEETEEVPQFQKPNFYQETLPGSPSPPKRKVEDPTVNPASRYNETEDYTDYNNDESSKVYVYDEEEFAEMTTLPVKPEMPDEFDWRNEQPSPPAVATHAECLNVNCQQDLDFASDVKFDEATQFSESSTDGLAVSSPDHHIIQKTEVDEESSNIYVETCVKQETKYSDEITAPPAFVVPSHLPRKQRELFLRVQQHLKKNNTVAGSPNATACSPPSKVDDPPIEEVHIKEEPIDKEVISNDDKWYSSEDEDEDCNKPITEVLKKIQQEPPKKLPEAPKPAMNLMEMLQKIQQKQKQPQQPDTFLSNLMGVISSTPTMIPPTLPKLPISLQDLKPKPAQSDSIIKDTVVAPVDPRLKIRDPRIKPAASESPTPDISESIPNNKPVDVALVDAPVENVPYRLHGIAARTPNYTPYILSSPDNPNLLKDPRLRRHLKTPEIIIDDPIVQDTTQSAKDVPPIPELLLKYNKQEVINIFESSSSKKNEALKMQAPDYVPIIKTSSIKPAIDYTPEVTLFSKLPVIEGAKSAPSYVPNIVPTKPIVDYIPEIKPLHPLLSTTDVISIPSDLKYASLDKPTYSPHRTDSVTSYDSKSPFVNEGNQIALNFFSVAGSVQETKDVSNDELREIKFDISKNSNDDISASKLSSTQPKSSDILDHKSTVIKQSVDKIAKPHIPITVKAQKLNILQRKKRSSRSDSGSQHSGSDTPPHLTIAESCEAEAESSSAEFEAAPVLESATGKAVLKKAASLVKQTKNINASNSLEEFTQKENDTPKIVSNPPKKENSHPKKENGPPRKENDVKKKSDPPKKENDPLKKENDPLKKENDPLKKENDPLKKENDPLKKESGPLKKENDSLKKESGPLKKENDSLKKENDLSKKKSDIPKKDNSSTKKKVDPPKKINEFVKKKKECVKKENDSDKKITDPLKRNIPVKKENESTQKEKSAVKKGTDFTKKANSSAKKENDSEQKGSNLTKKEIDSAQKISSLAKNENVSDQKVVNLTKKENDNSKKVNNSVKKDVDFSKKAINLVKKEIPCAVKEFESSEKINNLNTEEIVDVNKNDKSFKDVKSSKIVQIRSPSPEKEESKKNIKTPKLPHKKSPSPKKDILYKTEIKLSRRKSTSPERQVIFKAETKQTSNIERDSDKPPLVPPIIIKKIKTIPTSHLPKAISDPRMAKLHNPIGERRSRVVDNSKKNSKIADSSHVTKPLVIDLDDDSQEGKRTTRSTPKKRRLSDLAKTLEDANESTDQQEVRKTRSATKRRRLSDVAPPSAVEATNYNVDEDTDIEEEEPLINLKLSQKKRRLSDAQKANNLSELTAGKSEPTASKQPLKSKTIPKKRRLSDKGDDKRKTVHRNRKSSMDYASPLHSCNDSDSSKSLDYNSYNQRQKKTPPVQPTIAPESGNNLISDYLLSDSSSLDCDNSNDVNLKDKFRTIDPTASPFC